MNWKDRRNLLQRFTRRFGPEVSRLRYAMTKNALPFTVKTLKPLGSRPEGLGRLVLFAHFDAEDRVDEYVRFYLEKLYAAGSTIVVVSGSPWLSEEAVASIAPLCAGIYTRKTLSLDFGSWHLAWQHLQKAGWGLEQFDQLLLANDSVYGPLFDLEEMFSAFGVVDMCGATQSEEFAPHLQSYFLMWNLNSRTLRFIEEFWKGFRYITNKEELIQVCEIGLSLSARENGLSQTAYITDVEVRRRVTAHPDHESAEKSRGTAVSNMLFYWDILIAEMRCPFIKVALPRQNYFKLKNLREMPEVVGRYSEYDFTLIANHLRRLGKAVPGEGSAGG